MISSYESPSQDICPHVTLAQSGLELDVSTGKANGS